MASSSIRFVLSGDMILAVGRFIRIVAMLGFLLLEGGGWSVDNV